MTCGGCIQFVNEPREIEAMIPGLTAMGSARASVFSDGGICRLHDLIVSARDGCGRFSPRGVVLTPASSRPAT
jgi:hypothetical protein